VTASDPTDDRDKQDLARHFRAYLTDQTGIEILDIGAVRTVDGPEALRTAFERLDAAIGQLVDLASVYSDTPQQALEPLALPIAALAGEYLRVHLGGHWRAGDDAAGAVATIDLDDGRSIDVLSVVHRMLASGSLQLTETLRS
jgi:hypothetical protein